jgi:hypothetical protein
LGFGVWGLGPNPQSPIPNPQSPIPNPHSNNEINEFLLNKKGNNFIQKEIYIKVKNYFILINPY